MQTIFRIPCEAWNGFCYDHIYFSLFAESDHLIKSIASFYACTGNTFVRKNFYKCPIGIFVYHIDISGALRFVTVKLLLLFCRYTAICNHTFLPEFILGFFLRAAYGRDQIYFFCFVNFIVLHHHNPWMNWPFFNSSFIWLSVWNITL